MSKVNFYLLEKQTATGIYPFACGLLEKMVNEGKRVFVILNNLAECETFNKLLWTAKDISFVPHCLSTDAIAAATPIHLGLISQMNNHAIVLNLSHETVTELANVEQIIEIVPDEPAWRQASRKKFLNYKATQQCELNTHKIE